MQTRTIHAPDGDVSIIFQPHHKVSYRLIADTDQTGKWIAWLDGNKNKYAKAATFEEAVGALVNLYREDMQIIVEAG